MWVFTVAVSLLYSFDHLRNPPIDPKFLMKRDEAIPVRGLLNGSHKTSSAAVPSISPRLLPSASSSSSALVQPPSSVVHSTLSTSEALQINSTRISQQMIVPKAQPPLASAYFPSQSWLESKNLTTFIFNQFTQSFLKCFIMFKLMCKIYYTGVYCIIKFQTILLIMTARLKQKNLQVT